MKSSKLFATFFLWSNTFYQFNSNLKGPWASIKENTVYPLDMKSHFVDLWHGLQDTENTWRSDWAPLFLWKLDTVTVSESMHEYINEHTHLSDQKKKNDNKCSHKKLNQQLINLFCYTCIHRRTRLIYLMLLEVESVGV